MNNNHITIPIEARIQRMARICRFAGGTTRHYSVAEHTNHGINWIDHRYKEHPDQSLSLDLQRAFFIHDMPESRYGDMINPVKRNPHIEIEWNLMESDDFTEICKLLECDRTTYVNMVQSHSEIVMLDKTLCIVEMNTIADQYVQEQSRIGDGYVDQYKPNNPSHEWIVCQINEYPGKHSDGGFAELMGHYERLFT